MLINSSLKFKTSLHFFMRDKKANNRPLDLGCSERFSGQLSESFLKIAETNTP